MRGLPFHPWVRSWFEDTFARATAVQIEGWQRIAAGDHTLIAAPTGSGKTLAAFLWAIHELIERGSRGQTLADAVQTVYVSPLKALGNDIEKNLRRPLEEIRARAARSGGTAPEIRVAVRSGDTPSHRRSAQLRRPPHILITTPESLYLLLTAEGGRRMLSTASSVIVDEIHAVAADKRGTHLAVSLERFERLVDGGLQRIGLSATQNPIQEVARLLVGSSRLDADRRARCSIVDAGHRRDLDLSIETLDEELGPIAAADARQRVYERIAELALEHRTTLVFTNTRRMVERVAHALAAFLGEDKVAAHHGSLSRQTRLEAEQGLKSGRIPVVVATSSLELGIDVGHVDLVVHLGAPRTLAALLQRVGRSGHFLGATPKGIVFPLTRDDLMQAAAAVSAVRIGGLDRLEIRSGCLDVLAQQMVAATACEPFDADELFALIRRAYPYRDLSREDFDAVLETLCEGISTTRGRRSAHLHYDRVHGRLRARRGARLAALTGGGAIPDTADYRVLEEPAGTFVGTVNEDFAVESLAGDIFLLGNRSWRIRRVTSGEVRVEDAAGAPPTIPFWLGEAPARSEELSRAIAWLRAEIAAGLDDEDTLHASLRERCGVDAGGAEQLVAYVRATVAMLGEVPTHSTVIAERFFDEAGGMQLVLHNPRGGRTNRALGLALRKKFCRSFDFELQAAATDDGVVLSLGEQHSFPLHSVFAMLRPSTYRDDLVQATLASPMFTNRWRWNATRSLALARHQGGRRVPMPIQRMRAEDLLAAVFPAQLGCQDNRAGDIALPDHPLVTETVRDCLEEAMDVRALGDLVEDFGNGDVRTLAVETPAPSPMSQEILNANPYAFLDDAPLEERRARAVAMRRLDGNGDFGGLGRLDPEAVREVRRQAWPQPGNGDEVHDALLSLVVADDEAADPWKEHVEELLGQGRAFRVALSPPSAAPAGEAAEATLLAATERLEEVRAMFPRATLRPEPPPLDRARVPRGGRTEPISAEEALLGTVQGWMDAVGPIRAGVLAMRIAHSEARVLAALAALEARGRVLQGRFTQDAAGGVEWCERSLLARIHRFTLARLRRQIEPVRAADFLRFLLRWQHVEPGTHLHGRDGVREVIRRLAGLELPAPAWEASVLPARIADYDPADLEGLCLAGEVGWGRLSLPRSEEPGSRAPRRRQGLARSAPIGFFPRESLPVLLAVPAEHPASERLSSLAREVLSHLETRGASFLSDISQALGRLSGEVEDALWELVRAGRITGDGTAGLRTMLLPDRRRRSRRGRVPALRVLGGGGRTRLVPSGRWSLLRPADFPDIEEADRVEGWARIVLHRYGVVFRDLCARERGMPAWRRVHRVLRRMEDRGEVRGGRFVDGFAGEQFALPEAVETLRDVRRSRDSGEVVFIDAADPLNLLGWITPGARIPPTSRQTIALRAGVPIDVGALGELRSRCR